MSSTPLMRALVALISRVHYFRHMDICHNVERALYIFHGLNKGEFPI